MASNRMAYGLRLHTSWFRALHVRPLVLRQQSPNVTSASFGASPRDEGSNHAETQGTPKIHEAEPKSESSATKPVDIEAHMGRVELDGQSKDPYMYQKFAVKYGTGVLMFIGLMSAMHWYEKQIIQEREFMKKNPPPPPPNISPFAPRAPEYVSPPPAVEIPIRAHGSAVVNTAPSAEPVPLSSPLSSTSIESTGYFQVFSPTKDEGPALLPVEEMELECAELEARLKRLREKKRTYEIDRQKKEIKVRLKELERQLKTTGTP